MARTLITNHRISGTTPIATPAATAIDPVNGMVINHQAPYGKNGATILLHVKNTAATAKVVSLKPSDLAPGANSDTPYTIPAGAEMYIPIDTVRYQNADLSYRVDAEAGTTGTMLAIWAE